MNAGTENLGVDKLLNRSQVAALLGMSSSTLYRALRDGSLPPPIYITPGQPRWPASVIRGVIENAKAKAGYES